MRLTRLDVQTITFYFNRPILSCSCYLIFKCHNYYQGYHSLWWLKSTTFPLGDFPPPPAYPSPKRPQALRTAGARLARPGWPGQHQPEAADHAGTRLAPHLRLPHEGHQDIWKGEARNTTTTRVYVFTTLAQMSTFFVYIHVSKRRPLKIPLYAAFHVVYGLPKLLINSLNGSFCISFFVFDLDE